MNLPGIRVEAIPFERIIKRPQSRRRPMNHQPASRLLSPFNRPNSTQNQTQENDPAKMNHRTGPHTFSITSNMRGSCSFNSARTKG